MSEKCVELQAAIIVPVCGLYLCWCSETRGDDGLGSISVEMT